MADCDLVIEAIPENRALKRELFQSMDAIVGADCILGTNSSSIPPSELWVREGRDPLIVGMHFFYPVALKSTVEVMISSLTEPGVIEIVSQFLVAIKKTPLILSERNGFILNRLLLDVQNEAWHIVERQVASEEQIDRLVITRLFPFGLFSLIDSVGIETTRASVENYTREYPHVDYYQGFIDRLKALEREGKPAVIAGNISSSVPPLSSTVSEEILDHLKNTWLSSCKRFTMQSGCQLTEMNDAIKDYFDVDKGPFE